MVSLAKLIFKAILGVIAFVLFAQLIAFFPWYMTMVIETFNVSNAVANDNYLKPMYFDNTVDQFDNLPIYSETPVTNYNGRDSGIGISVVRDSDGEEIANWNTLGFVDGNDELDFARNNVNDNEKPYRQRGEIFTVELSANYPLEIEIGGNVIRRELPFSFSMRTVGLKYYKDLDYDYAFLP